MNRRTFLKQGLLAGTAMVGTGLSTGCSRHPRRRMTAENFTALEFTRLSGRGYLGPVERQILFYASLAPSGHNSQPWSVRLAGPGEWVVGSDRSRWLPVVDPDNREVLLSIGAFTENLVQAARAFGYEADMEILAKGRFDPEVLRVWLSRSARVNGAGPNEPSPNKAGALGRMAARRTIKNGLKPEAMTPKDVKILKEAAGGDLYYFPRGSSHALAMAEAAVENFKIQFDNQEAMAEAAQWTRLSDEEAETCRDGLTPDGMEIHGLAGFWVRHFMDKADVTGRLWREKAVEKVEAQVLEGGGWLVITSPSHGIADLIGAGRRFQRLALAAVPMGLGIHPMTQTLEERHGRKAVRDNHAPSMIPQFMLRIGYVSPYPEPVSLRRPVERFVTGRVIG